MNIRVLIIDDDRIELDRFIRAISWANLGFEIVGTAFNGIIGYKEYVRLSPDLVITDIEMPGMSGIELAEKIRKSDENTKIVFLSSHEKFIFDIINDFDNNQSKLYLETVQNKYATLAIFEESSLPFFSQLLNLHEYKKISITDIKKVIQSQFDCLIIPLNNDGYLTFIKVDQNEDISKKLDLMCLDLLDLLNNSFNRSFYIVKLCNSMSVLDVKERLNDLFKYYNLRNFFDNNSIIDVSDLKEKACLTDKVDNILLNQLIKAMDVSQLKLYIDHIFAPILEGKQYNAFNENLNSFCFYLGENAKELIDFENKNLIDFFDKKRVIKITTIKLAIKFIKECYEEYYKIIKQKHNFSNYVENAIRFIYQNYQKNSINLEDIASNIALSSTRLRTIFKNETGKTIHQYITDIRMDKAKQLLQDDKQKKLNLIAKEVGYLNGKYLSRVFKREIGITPETFRMRNTNEEDQN